MSFLRLIKVLIVADLPIHYIFTICLGLPKFIQFAIYIFLKLYYYISKTVTSSDVTVLPVESPASGFPCSSV